MDKKIKKFKSPHHDANLAAREPARHAAEVLGQADLVAALASAVDGLVHGRAPARPLPRQVLVLRQKLAILLKTNLATREASGDLPSVAPRSREDTDLVVFDVLARADVQLVAAALGLVADAFAVAAAAGGR